MPLEGPPFGVAVMTLIALRGVGLTCAPPVTLSPPPAEAPAAKLTLGAAAHCYAFLGVNGGIWNGGGGNCH